MKIIRFPHKKTWTELIKRPVFDSRSVDKTVIPVLEAVKHQGDRAVLEYTRQFDDTELDSLVVDENEIVQAEKETDGELRKSIELAIRNIEKFHGSQKTGVEKIEIMPGVVCWQKPVPIEKVGLYIPGGSAPLFSTVLMLAIPARIAGCSEVVLCTPPGKDGRVHPAILFAAKATGVTRIFRVGGVQAIAAMAYGTASIPKVYKIFGPGNQYVTAAKQLVSRENVAIDMPAGPSELAVMADGRADPSFVASDLLSQAEHGADSQVLLITSSPGLIDRVIPEINRQMELLPRKDIARKSLEHSRLILMRNSREMVGLVNEYAPEHLIISTADAASLAEHIVNAGSVFIGDYTPESAGDYLSGTNHTLPTNGYARMYNGVNLDDFVKKITFQHITHEGLAKIGPAIMKMAATEKLNAHRNAVGLRLKGLLKNDANV
ncbi:MAG: histidinol dehydrogenase [Bacteroidales bacterium]|nr:histidinol dehydrogenase [Bacteroidales bacterium]